MSFPLAPFGPRTGLRGMVNAADQLASIAGVGVLEQGGTAADAPWPPPRSWPSPAPTCAAWAATCWPWSALPDPIRWPCWPSAGPDRASTPARMRAGATRSWPCAATSTASPCRGRWMGGSRSTTASGGSRCDTVLGPAIELAEEGFVASILLALSSHLVAGLPGARTCAPTVRPDPGDLVRLPGVARTLRAIVAGGREGFYSGEFGNALVELGEGVFTAVGPRAQASPNGASRCGSGCGGTTSGRSLRRHRATSPWPAHGSPSRPASGRTRRIPLWAHLVVEATRAAGHDRPTVLHDGADGPGAPVRAAG